MATTITSRVRTDSPERWMKAAERAVAEGIRVRQLQSTGQWVCKSGSDDHLAYEVQVTGNVAHGCDCLAGLNGDPVCKHRAAWYVAVGAIDLAPEPPPAAPVLPIVCQVCNGAGVTWDRELERHGQFYPPCPACRGTGTMPEPATLLVAPSVDADRVAA